MVKPKTRPRVGDECWFVEWVHELAWVDGEVDRDRCKTRTRRVTTREEAERLAREVWPQTRDIFGYVEYWPARLEPYDEAHAEAFPHVGFWEPTGDAEIYEGEE